MDPPLSPSNITKEHIHGNDPKQDRLDDQTLAEVERVGGSNFIQASYFRYLCVATIGSDRPKLASLQPEIKIGHSESWNQALRLVLAVLRRRKMDQTLSAIRHEYAECPRTTGYAHAADVDKRMDQLIGKPGLSTSNFNETRDLNVIPVTPK